jgi:hypothetical protein
VVSYVAIGHHLLCSPIWILPGRYDRKEKLFGISPEWVKARQLSLSPKVEKLTGFLVLKSLALENLSS